MSVAGWSDTYGMSGIWTQDHWVPLRCSNRLSYPAMSSTYKRAIPTLIAQYLGYRCKYWKISIKNWSFNGFFVTYGKYTLFIQLIDEKADKIYLEMFWNWIDNQTSY